MQRPGLPAYLHREDLPLSLNLWTSVEKHRRVETRSPSVFHRKIRFIYFDRPFNPQLRIIEADSPIIFPRIERSCFIRDLGLVGKSHETVSESRRNPELAPVGSREFYTKPPPEPRTRSTYVDRDIPDLPRDAPHQFPLRVRSLIMETPQHALNRLRMIVLNKTDGRIDLLSEESLVPRFVEPSPIVFENHRFKHLHFGDLSIENSHRLLDSSLDQILYRLETR